MASSTMSKAKESIDKWKIENNNAKLCYVNMLKELAFLSLSWADKSRVPFDDAINQTSIDKKLLEIQSYCTSGR